MSLRIGVIGGGGWLAGALLRPALASGIIDPAALILSSRKGTVAGFETWPAITVTSDNQALADKSDVVILSVRPGDLDQLTLDLRGKLIISVMAGIPAADLATRYATDRVIRSMPNACAEWQQGFAPWFATEAVTGNDRDIATRFFAASGKTIEIPREEDLDYFTALTGSGASMPALMADAMIGDAIARGIAPEIAEMAVRQLMLGAGTTIALGAAKPGAIVREFYDYGGTTAAGLKAMMDGGLPQAVVDGLKAATDRARAYAIRQNAPDA